MNAPGHPLAEDRRAPPDGAPDSTPDTTPDNTPDNTPADLLAHTLQRHRQLACQAQRLDDELGLHHGLSWHDLLLLDTLHTAGGRLPARQAAAATGRSPAGLLRQVLPMEKTGLVQRARDGRGQPQLVLAGGGARRLHEACDTARALLVADAAKAAPPAAPPAAQPAAQPVVPPAAQPAVPPVATPHTASA